MPHDHPVISPKKLIEVALPLDAINAACAREKSIRHGHPSTLHLWWARRPLAAARAVIFAQLVNDPEDLWRCQNPGKDPNKQVRGHWTKARARLFELIEELVKWENTTNDSVLERAREEIRKSWREVCDLNNDHPQAAELFNPDKMPGLHDPFAGGGAIPLEAQRLGLEAHASDLNPVAVLINKAMIEFPPKFAGRPPVNPEVRHTRSLIQREWTGAAGLAEDVRYYGQWMRDEANKRIGHLYPAVEITPEMVKERPDLKPYQSQKLPVIAWLWARTVKSPNPAFSNVDIPLASTFVLSSKSGKEVYVQPVIEGDSFRLTVKVGQPPVEAKSGTSLGKQKGFRCLLSKSPISYEYIRMEGLRGRLGTTLMAIVAQVKNGRVYLPPAASHESIARGVTPHWKPNLRIPEQALGFRVQLYGMLTFGDLFTPRQQVAMATLSDLVSEARERAWRDATASGLHDDAIPLEADGGAASAYADAISVYLAFANSKVADRSTTITRWMHQRDSMHSTFSKQSLPMNWDYVEVNTLGEQTGGFGESLRWTIEAMEGLGQACQGVATQADAMKGNGTDHPVYSTDPPYYDNIGYADLSDFFYVWLRRSLRDVFPHLLATISVPKAEELVATPFRHGTKRKAEKFFLDGMTQVMRSIATQAHHALPVTIYYAFKQSETVANGTNSSGWETFLEAVLSSGLLITGTWPIRTERAQRSVSLGTNSLASSIVLVCRSRPDGIGTVSRRQLVRELNTTLPPALDTMTREGEGLHSPVAPVDLSQAIIGPGMAVFSKYSAVLEADGSPMTVRTALQLINRFLAEDDFDADTQFCLHWFEQHYWDVGKFGEADTLARAKGTSVDGVKQAGVLYAAGGNVRLLKWSEYPVGWDPASDSRLPVWEALHQLIRVLRTEGESGAGVVLAQVLSQAEAARQLAYRLYTLCERAGMAEDARAYNELITSWSAIEAAAAREPAAQQRTLFD